MFLSFLIHESKFPPAESLVYMFLLCGRNSSTALVTSFPAKSYWPIFHLDSRSALTDTVRL